MSIQINIEEVIPSIMHLLKFRGALSVEGIYRCTGYGKATIRNAISSMIKNGLISKHGLPLTYSLNANSRYWIGWKKEQGWAELNKE